MPAEPPHPEDATYLRRRTNLRTRGGLNPWQHHIELRVTSATLRLGDIVEISLRAWEGPTFSTADGYFLLLISPAGDQRWTRLVDPPWFHIQPGAPSDLIAIAPADGSMGDKATVRIRATDQWKNATPDGCSAGRHASEVRRGSRLGSPRFLDPGGCASSRGPGW